MLDWVKRVNLPYLLLIIFLFHSLLYILLGTDNWLATALLATAFYGVVLYALRAMVGRRQRLK